MSSAAQELISDDGAVNVIFIGAGAVGCFYASRLHHPDLNVYVSLVARSNYAAISESGVKLTTHSFGNYVFKPHATFPSVESAAACGQDGNRSDDSAMITPLIDPGTCIVLIQNGVGVEEPFRKRFPRNPIVSAVTIVSAEQTAPGVIRQNRWTRISIGPHTGGLGKGGGELEMLGAEAVELLCKWWGPDWGGIRDVEPHDAVGLQMVRWHKLCINAAFNPSAVLSGGRANAEIVNDEELREHVIGVMNEIRAAVPKVLGRGFPDDMAKPDRIVKSTERNTGARPSMLLDWEAGRPLELEVILGNPVRIARAHGAEMPRLQTLYALLKSAQKSREGQRVQNKL
ncbi:putative 2-dehydropantoate 2-reductase [Colletotrichum orbiculare MAFF 240422]|uniref:2-dehydropantoate 2-reductase n=1 Tax=Colletotrichum orbiculare (strain 104-T / ATCC 96160 / CBS 514.97 / LARS 414 / MAFF 240422) TaxID=1213857 RepID=A0A484G5G3_COLOR|nr:putative 2-dehydropantoate 2-reductase [Colletotrichum orbiculare MAFF 240422]